MSKINYIIGGQRLTEEEYRQQYGDPPNRLDTFKGISKLERPIFEPYYDAALGKYITSYAAQEREVNRHNNLLKRGELKDCHKRELGFASDDHKFIKECKNTRKNKRDIVWDRYVKSGKNPEVLTETHRRWFGLDKKKLYFT